MTEQYNADLSVADRTLIEQWIDDGTATERPQGSPVVWQADARRIAHNAHQVGQTAGYIAGLRSAAARREFGELTFAHLALTNRSRCERWHPGFPLDGWSDLAAAVIDKFNAVSVREGFPERLTVESGEEVLA
jgi:hypothetical protein